MDTIQFKNLAYRGFRLSAAVDKPEGIYTITHLEIGGHRTSREGHIYVDEELTRPAEDGRMTYCARMKVFLTFERMAHYLQTEYGPSNIEDFKTVIEDEIKEMLANPHVQDWKGLKRR